MRTICTIDVIKEIIKNNPSIKKLNLGAYKYVPCALDEKGRLKIHPIKYEDFKSIREKILSIKFEKGWNLALLSKVTLKNGSHRHIPQIDFECPISKKNLSEIKSKLSEILKISPGYVLNSGVSYHFIGLRLLDENEWHYFMGLVLLLTKHHSKSIVDIRWCGHQLMSGRGSIRILSNHIRPEPKVVAFLKT